LASEFRRRPAGDGWAKRTDHTIPAWLAGSVLKKSPTALLRQGKRDHEIRQNVILAPTCQLRGSCCALAFPKPPSARLVSKFVRFGRLKTLKNSNRNWKFSRSPRCVFL